MPYTSQVLDWVQANPNLSIPFIGALLVALVGGGLQLLGHWLRNKAALAVEQMKLRHEIASRWLAEFDAQVQKVWQCFHALQQEREVIDPIDPGKAVTQLHRYTNLLYGFEAAVQALLDTSLVVALSLRQHPRSAPGWTITDAATACSTAAEEVLAHYLARYRALLTKIDEAKRRPDAEATANHAECFHITGDIANFGRFAMELAVLCSLVNWASEERTARRQFRVDRKDVSQLLRDRRAFIARQSEGREDARDE